MQGHSARFLAAFHPMLAYGDGVFNRAGLPNVTYPQAQNLADSVTSSHSKNENSAVTERVTTGHPGHDLLDFHVG